jgi:ubiquinone/menaquinone biosynthesis C-methylase UbiE
MILNSVEYFLMNNPIRAAIQRHFEARRLLRMGGPVSGGHALEVGCGCGIGIEIILATFDAASVDAFDLDPRMVERARARLAQHGSRTRLWVGDASCICAPDGTYDAVFDFGIIHHIPEWRRAVDEIHRVLKPGGILYAEEALRRLIVNPISSRLVKHPQTDRFDATMFVRELRNTGFVPIAIEELWGSFAWFTARKRGEA